MKSRAVKYRQEADPIHLITHSLIVHNVLTLCTGPWYSHSWGLRYSVLAPLFNRFYSCSVCSVLFSLRKGCAAVGRLIVVIVVILVPVGGLIVDRVGTNRL